MATTTTPMSDAAILAALTASERRATEHGDIAFVILCAALVFIMTPGLGYFYSGMARTKNALSLIMLCFLSMAVVLIQWTLFGFSLAFSEHSNSIIGDFYYGGGTNVGAGFLENVAPISSATFFLYQAMFACISPALIFGSTAERMRVLPAIGFIFLWTTIVYDFAAHWTWAANGWLMKLGAIDFAGGGPVHIATGFSGFAMALVLGRRYGFHHEAKNWKPHSLNNVLLGTALLWFGWFGFNGGSAIAGTTRAAMAAVVTNISAATGGLTWVIIDYIMHDNKVSSLAFCSGAVAGLVGITPGSGFVAPWAAIIIGFTTATICNFFCRLKHVLGYDDSLDAFGVHGVGGFYGNIITGVFAQKWVANLDGMVFEGGAIDGHWKLIGYQIAASVAIAAWAFLWTTILTLIMPCLRLSPEHQEIGVDLLDMGETAYYHGDHPHKVQPIPTVERWNPSPYHPYNAQDIHEPIPRPHQSMPTPLQNHHEFEHVDSRTSLKSINTMY